jgi:putative ABC transport system permease protein
MGFVLKLLFATKQPAWVLLMALVMLLLAAREVGARQRRRFRGTWAFGIGGLAMFLSTFSIVWIALAFMIDADPWYQPRFAIPLLGMLLGNTMTGIGLALDRLTQGAHDGKGRIEAQLALGRSAGEAIADLRRDSIRSGMVPMINALVAAGLIHLPGMMTGQILAGADPVEAVKYQILIMFLIAGGTGLGTLGAITLGARRLFDERQRLRLDRLAPPRD